MEVISHCQIVRSIVDPDVMCVFSVNENGERELLFTYYSNELSFSEDEFIGLTYKEARELHWERDLIYLREEAVPN